MKLTINKSVILRDLTIAQEIIQAKNALSIISNVLLSVEDGKLSIKATDLKVNYQTSIPCQMIEPGTTAVFCDKLLNVVRNMPECEIEFTKKDSILAINPIGQKINFKLRCIDHSNYPEFISSSVDFFTLSQHSFSEMINSTSFAVSDDETRYFLNGVYFNGSDMVATDGRRLSFIQSESPTPFEGVIIPTKILGMVRKMMLEGNIEISIDKKTIFFKMDNMILSSSLIDGKFPQYERITSETPERKAICLRNHLSSAIKRVSLLAEGKSRRIFITVSNNLMTLSSEESEIGTAKEEIPCSYSGETTTIAMNYTYITEPLKSIDTDEIEFCFTDSSRPVMIYTSPKGRAMHMIQPMQVG